MSGINFRPEDLGTRLLEKDNEAPGTPRAVTPATSYPRVHSTEEQPAPEPPAGPAYRGKDRRKGGDRRKKDVPVLLDTRSKRERRRAPQPSAEGEEPPIRGIDEIC